MSNTYGIRYVRYLIVLWDGLCTVIYCSVRPVHDFKIQSTRAVQYICLVRSVPNILSSHSQLLQLDSARRRLRKRMSTGGLADGDGSYWSEAAGAKYSKSATRIARDSSGSPSPCIASSGNLPGLAVEAEPLATSSVEKISSSAANFWSQVYV